MDEILTCKKCNKFYLEPVLLPCSKQTCRSHVEDYSYSIDKEYVRIFKCEFCDGEHEIPENGFPVIQSLVEILNLNLHLNDKGKEAHDLIGKFDTIVSDLNFTNKDPENFIYDYISNTRNQIHLERERLTPTRRYLPG